MLRLAGDRDPLVEAARLLPVLLELEREARRLEGEAELRAR